MLNGYKCSPCLPSIGHQTGLSSYRMQSKMLPMTFDSWVIYLAGGGLFCFVCFLHTVKVTGESHPDLCEVQKKKITDIYCKIMVVVNMFLCCSNIMTSTLKA